MIWALACGIAVLSAFTARAAEIRDSNGPDWDSHYQKSCLTSGCHTVRDADRVPTHSPYLEGNCLACHQDHSAGGKPPLLASDDSLCLSCHTEVEMAPGESQPHDANGKTCIDCHSGHQGRNRNLVRDAERLNDCVACHEPFLEESAKKPYRHDFFNPRGECGICHYAHRRSTDKYLRENVAETCLTCHDLPISLNTRSLENLAATIRTAPKVHEPLKSPESCPICHTPHGADQPALLRSGYPANNYQPYQSDQYSLCWQCHDRAIVESDDPEGKATAFRDGDKNLHKLHVAELKRGRVCGLCHSPHTSDDNHLMRQSTYFGQWKAPLKYTELPEGGSCLTPCHRQKEYQRNPPTMSMSSVP